MGSLAVVFLLNKFIFWFCHIKYLVVGFIAFHIWDGLVDMDGW